MANVQGYATKIALTEFLRTWAKGGNNKALQIFFICKALVLLTGNFIAQPPF
jgi:hypothetical protein